MGFAVLKWIEVVRGERFGQEHARVRLSVEGAVLPVGGASLGLVLVVGFIPRAISTHAPMDIVLRSSDLSSARFRSYQYEEA
jgi:hypothetical protein